MLFGHDFIYLGLFGGPLLYSYLPISRSALSRLQIMNMHPFLITQSSSLLNDL